MQRLPKPWERAPQAQQGAPRSHPCFPITAQSSLRSWVLLARGTVSIWLPWRYHPTSNPRAPLAAAAFSFEAAPKVGNGGHATGVGAASPDSPISAFLISPGSLPFAVRMRAYRVLRSE